MRGLMLAAVVLFGVGCEKLCVPGKSESCVGPGGCAGGQTCNAEGTGFGACDCGTAGGTGGGTGGGSIGGGGGAIGGGGGATGGGGGATGGGGGATGGGGGQDAGVDAGVPCDPTPTDGGSTGCPSGQRCTWISLTATTGQIGCAPNGTVAGGAACTQGTPGATTGFDNCVAGQICINAVCSTACSLNEANSCGSSGNCTAYSGLFANDPDQPTSGACVPTCDPLSGVPCGTGKGCYLLTSQTATVAVCANAGTVGHGQTIGGTAFANSCVSGAMPRAIFNSTMKECGGLCAPSDVTTGTNQANEGGVPPESCQMRWSAPAASDATAGESCRYFWAREQLPGLSRFSNTLGFCFKHAAWQYDSNNDAVPDLAFPRCTAVTTGDVLPPVTGTENDALSFWCIQKPAMKRSAEEPRAGAAWLTKLTGWR